MFLKVLQNSQENTCCQSMKLQATGCVFCEFSEIFNSTFFIEHLRATASGSIITLVRYCYCVYTPKFLVDYVNYLVPKDLCDFSGSASTQTFSYIFNVLDEA